jgi:hypothetical protein
VKARTLTAVLAILAAGAACRATAPVPVRVEMPGISPFPSGSLTAIIVTNFRNDALIPGFDAGLELQAYIAAEIGSVFKGSVSRLALSSDVAAGNAGPSFWRDAGAGRDRAVFLTGSLSFASQLRKALKGTRASLDRPFKAADRRLFERLHWTLRVDMFLISAASGEILFQKTFREERDYSDIEKPAEFAFSELSGRIRAKLLTVLLGSSTIEPRTLLVR